MRSAFPLLLVLLSSLARAQAPSAFATLPEDPAPPHIVRGIHYWVSNEDSLELFRPAVKDKRGLYLGVGAEQNYLLAAWARSEVLVLLDFDGAIADLHRVYRVLFRAAPTPQDFYRLWSPGSRDEVHRLIQEGYPEGPRREAVLKVYNQARPAVERQLRRLREHMKQLSLPCFLEDEADYAHLRRLSLEDRVFMVRGDLTASDSVRAVGRAAAEQKLSVGVLYLSNAEGYFEYGPQFRENIRALPLTAESVVVRTSGQRGVSHVKGSYYHYNTQSGSSFLAWLADAGVKDVRAMLSEAPDVGDVPGLSRLDLGPEQTREARRQQGSPPAPAPAHP